MRIYLAGGNNKERIMQNLSLAGEESMKLKTVRYVSLGKV